jgi:TolB-like protein
MIKYITLLVFFFLLFIGCSNQNLSRSNELPYFGDGKIALYPLENYTDTPRAGMRASNILEGVLLAKDYKVDSRLNNKTREMSIESKIADAKKRGDKYLIVGGVSEWRYKTGIDGEPAVSIFIKMIDSSTRKIVWSAAGSDNDWGNASIGSVAQRLLESMISQK